MRCLPLVVDEVMIAIRGAAGKIRTLSVITDPRPFAKMQYEAFVTATAVEVKRRMRVTQDIYTGRYPTHHSNLTEDMSFQANHRDRMKTTGS